MSDGTTMMSPYYLQFNFVFQTGRFIDHKVDELEWQKFKFAKASDYSIEFLHQTPETLQYQVCECLMLTKSSSVPSLVSKIISPAWFLSENNWLVKSSHVSLP